MVVSCVISKLRPESSKILDFALAVLFHDCVDQSLWLMTDWESSFQVFQLVDS